MMPASDTHARCPDTPANVRLLWIDDELRGDDPLVLLLRREGVQVSVATTGEEGLRLARQGPHDVIAVDLNLPDLFGATVLTRLSARGTDAALMVVAGTYLQPETESEVLRAGARVCLQKPLFSAEVLLDGMRRAMRARTRGDGAPFGIAGSSLETRQLVQWIERVAPTGLNVLITGETGTGKELVATAVHRASKRRDRPFVAVNCGAIPDALFESEMFGHRKGAFTGAIAGKVGLVEAADGGTLFLDEVGEMPPRIQVGLLRVLDDGRIRRLGETTEKRVDVRVIAATNRDLLQCVRRGTFRQDLYYRLAAAQRTLAPLRERPDDLEGIIAAIAEARRRRGEPLLTIAPAAIPLLRRHAWPGNVRELKNVIERAAALSASHAISEQEVRRALDGTSMEAGDGTHVQDESARLEAALAQNRWDRKAAARQLGLSRTTLWRKLRRHGLVRSTRDVS